MPFLIKVGVGDLIYNIKTNGCAAMRGTRLINLHAMAFYLLAHLMYCVFLKLGRTQSQAVSLHRALRCTRLLVASPGRCSFKIIDYRTVRECVWSAYACACVWEGRVIKGTGVRKSVRPAKCLMKNVCSVRAIYQIWFTERQLWELGLVLII